MYSKHFKPTELACKHCGKDGTTQELRDALDALRDEVGQPILVHDAYRCEEHNRAVGGVPKSEHPMGMAADIEIPGWSQSAMYNAALHVHTFANGGIGLYDHGHFIHVDVRQGMARWSRVAGKYVGIHEVLGMHQEVQLG